MGLILNASIVIFNKSGKSESSRQLLTKKLFHEITDRNLTMANNMENKTENTFQTFRQQENWLERQNLIHVYKHKKVKMEATSTYAVFRDGERYSSSKN